jgi:hypothetical protein
MLIIAAGLPRGGKFAANLANPWVFFKVFEAGSSKERFFCSILKRWDCVKAILHQQARIQMTEL